MRSKRIGPAVFASAILLMWLGSGANVRAQSPTSTSVEARAEFKIAETHYAIQEFDTAIVHYKKAYELSKAPALLFNIAQAYKGAEQHDYAIEFYETYLRLVPNAKNERDVERYIAELKEKRRVARAKKQENERIAREAKSAESERKRAEAARVRLEAEAEAARAQAELRRAGGPQRVPNTKLKVAGLVTGGVGLGITAVGIVFGFQARSDFNTVNSTEEWSLELDEVRSSAESARTKSYLFTGIGAAAVITGGALYFLGRRGSLPESSATVGVVPTDGGGAIVIGGQF